MQPVEVREPMVAAAAAAALEERIHNQNLEYSFPHCYTTSLACFCCPVAEPYPTPKEWGLCIGCAACDCTLI